MIGMQSSLDRILAAVQSQNQASAALAHGAMYSANGARHSPIIGPPLSSVRNGGDMYESGSNDAPLRPRQFPPLPGFAPPVLIISSDLFSFSLIVIIFLAP